MIVICIVSLWALPHVLFAQLTGGDYEIYGDTFSFVSGNTVSGGVYDLYASGGEFFSASSAGGDYALRGGYRAVEKGILRVDVSTSSISYDTLIPGLVASSSIDIIVSTDNATGYMLYVREDQAPTANGTDTIADVSDTLVDGDTEEYGLQVLGDDTLVPPGVDIAITTSSAAIAQASGSVEQQRTTLVYKVAIDGATPDGLYTHTLIHSVFVSP